jgi:copper(I)-binding protein
MNRTALRMLALVALAIGLIGFSGSATAQHDATPEGSPMAGGMMGDAMGGTGAAYFLIENAGSEADRLILAAADVADVVEIHEIADNNGVMEMRPLADGLEIPAGETVALEPGGYHIMLIGLKDDLTAGMTFDLILTFEHAGEVVVPVTVQHEAPEGDAIVSTELGDLTISGVWSRPAPAISMEGSPAASPQASPTM